MIKMKTYTFLKIKLKNKAGKLYINHKVIAKNTYLRCFIFATIIHNYNLIIKSGIFFLKKYKNKLVWKKILNISRSTHNL